MARNSQQLREAITELEAKRSQPRSQASRDELREKIDYLKGELMLQKAREQWEAEQRQRPESHECGNQGAFNHYWCARCGAKLDRVIDVGRSA